METPLRMVTGRPAVSREEVSRLSHWSRSQAVPTGKDGKPVPVFKSRQQIAEDGRIEARQKAEKQGAESKALKEKANVDKSKKADAAMRERVFGTGGEKTFRSPEMKATDARIAARQQDEMNKAAGIKQREADNAAAAKKADDAMRERITGTGGEKFYRSPQMKAEDARIEARKQAEKDKEGAAKQHDEDKAAAKKKADATLHQRVFGEMKPGGRSPSAQHVQPPSDLPPAPRSARHRPANTRQTINRHHLTLRTRSHMLRQNAYNALSIRR